MLLALLVAACLELLAEISRVEKAVAEESMVEVLSCLSLILLPRSLTHMQLLLPLLCLCLPSPSPLQTIAGGEVVTRAAITSLSRLALYLGYDSGREFLRSINIQITHR